MKETAIPSSNNLFRACLFPEAIKSNAFSIEKMIFLKEGTDGHMRTSVIWERFAPSEKYVHAYGERLAFKRNEILSAQRPNHKDKDRRTYAGAYQFTSGSIKKLAESREISEVVSSDVVHIIENGEIAHANLQILLNTGAINTASIKTEIIDFIWRELRGPMISKIPASFVIRPNTPPLPTPPKGPYSDDRKYAVILFYLIRFRILSCFFMRRKKS